MSRGRLIATGVFGVALLGLGPSAGHAALLDANCAAPADSGSTGGVQAQTFTAAHTGTLVRGVMFVAKEPGPDFQMYILNAGPSGPTGGALGTTTIPDSSVPNVPSPSPTGPAAPVNGTFSPGVSVTAGQQYAIVVTRSEEGFLRKDNSPDPCPGNEFSGTVGGDWTLTEPNFDYPFQTFVNPTNAFTVGKLKKRKLFVTVPGPGTISARNAGGGGKKAIASAKKLLKTSTATAAAAGRVAVKLKPTKLAKSLLAENGKLKLKAAITYTPTGGDPNTVRKKLKLR
jgi:hypothetical protein